MAIALEKILTTKQERYEATHYMVRGYNEVGVHHIGEYNTQEADKALRDFAELVPAEAEAVTDLVFSLSMTQSNGTSRYVMIQYSGTALIPLGTKSEGRRTEPM
ncbi:MAG: hypothetical protein V1743_08000 [Nanoarchaeota archaeon]